jgi:DNA-binding transcriptional LysR family regulator
MPTLKQFRYLQSIVEHGSFSRASAQLFIAQSALSRQIKLLEQELGFVIFERAAHKTQLSAAGQVLYQKLSQQLPQLSAAIQHAQAYAKGQGRSLLLAHSSSVIMDPYKLAGLSEFCQQQQCRIELIQLSSEQQVEALAKAEIDLGLFRPPLKSAMHSLQQQRCYASHLYVAVHCADRLFMHKDRVSLKDLEHCRFVALPHPQRGGLSHLVANLCLAQGFQLQPAAIQSRKISQLALVAQGLGICIVPAEFASVLPAQVRLLALEEPCQTEVHLCWANHQDALLRQCVTALQQHLAGYDGLSASSVSLH